MSPFGPYASFDECVSQNQDKSSPEGFCSWLEHKITGSWPGQMVNGIPWPPAFMDKYDEALSGGLPEGVAYKAAVDAATAVGWEESRFGWLKQYQAPKMRRVADIPVFATGQHTDSAGQTRDWTNEDLEKMVEAFRAGVPSVVPLKCGHTSDEFNRRIAEALEVPVEVITGEYGQGQIKLGTMVTLEKRGNLLVATFDKVPEPISNLIEGGQFATVSSEIEDKVGDFGPVVTGVALLGAEEPAVPVATLDRALVFGGKREGARVLSFMVGDDIPTEVLRSQFKDIRSKMSELVKGLRGAPFFRDLFGQVDSLFESMIAKRKTKHAQPGNDGVPDEVRAYADTNYQGNIQALINWAGTVGFDECVTSLQGKPGITDPVRVCGWLKGRTESAPKGGMVMKNLPTALAAMSADDIKALTPKDLATKFSEGDAVKVGDIIKAFQEGDLAAIAAALGLAETATLEDIMAAIEGLKAQVTAPGPPAPEGEMKAEFTKLGQRIDVLEKENAQLKDDAVLQHYQKETDGLLIPESEPGDLARELAATHKAQGNDVAEKMLKRYKAQSVQNRKTLTVIGSSKDGEPTNTFEAEVQKFQKENPTKTYAEAIKAVGKAHPDLWAARNESDT